MDRSSEAALFRPITRSRSGVTLRRQGSLSYTRARELVKEALKKAGRDPDKYGLHSLRSGGGLQLLRMQECQIEPLRDMVDGDLKMPRTDT